MNKTNHVKQKEYHKTRYILLYRKEMNQMKKQKYHT